MKNRTKNVIIAIVAALNIGLIMAFVIQYGVGVFVAGKADWIYTPDGSHGYSIIKTGEDRSLVIPTYEDGRIIDYNSDFSTPEINESLQKNINKYFIDNNLLQNSISYNPGEMNHFLFLQVFDGNTIEDTNNSEMFSYWIIDVQFHEYYGPYKSEEELDATASDIFKYEVDYKWLSTKERPKFSSTIKFSLD